MTHIIVNGSMIAHSQATLDCADRGFRFGDGVFETVPIHNGVAYQWPLHLARLREGLDALKIHADTDNIELNIKELIKKLHVSNGFMRISISRGVGSAGYRPLPNITPTSIIEFIPRIIHPLTCAALWQSSYRKPPASAYPSHVKTAQGLNSTLALVEANEQHCDEALLLTMDGHLCEAASANLFWFRERTLFTPDLASGCLAGTTRDAVLRLCPYPIEHIIAQPEELARAECVFLTNCNWLLLPVTSLAPQGWNWPIQHPVIAELSALLHADIQHHCEQHSHD